MKKSKVTWLKLGDGNNAYFHAIVKEKNKQVGLHSLEDKHGNVLRKGAQLQDYHKERLVQQFTKQDIWSALNNIGEAKAPGMDG
ncbi:hypothetical protein KIW84_051516 [Lathyrus oleraceus]|uniref:Uncharacterized protein n=1 Tax=Pisum sativum TaxID=3888 RepID=A0A9D4WMA9_PEA|nr:hypothetical protein KIW84_051516 [Pisum sativum]